VQFYLSLQAAIASPFLAPTPAQSSCSMIRPALKSGTAVVSTLDITMRDNKNRLSAIKRDDYHAVQDVISFTSDRLRRLNPYARRKNLRSSDSNTRGSPIRLLRN
jgi:hypothetical protein